MKTASRIMFAIALLIGGLIATDYCYADDLFSVDLLAGQTLDVGDVTVMRDNGDLIVNYIIDPNNDWCLTETHLQAVTSYEEIPQKNGNPIPGQFDYKNEHQCVKAFTYNLGSLSEDIYIAAHAVVARYEYKCYKDTGNSVVYGMQRDTGKIFSIDASDGTPLVELFDSSPPPSASNVGPNGLAYDSVNERLYYCDYDGRFPYGPTTLYFWDRNANNQQEAGSLGNVEIADAGFYNGKYYYITGPPASDDLYEVAFNGDGTIAAGYPHIIADIADNAHGWTFNGDIAILDGVVYGWGLCGESGHGYEFFTYNLTNGDFNVVKPTYQASLQLAFGADGVLYGHRSGGNGNFYTVDTTNGTASEIIWSQGVTSPLFTDCASGTECERETFTETAWADGDSFSGSNWATYFIYPPPSTTE